MSRVYKQHRTLPYYITTDINAFDLKQVHAWISATYWAKDIPFDILARSFENSLAFGLFHDDGRQVGCARMITDRATFAYLGDVYIDGSCRRNKLGRWLMDAIMAHPELQGLRRMMLATSDMHALYRQVGFKDLAKPEIIMEIARPDIYSKR